LNLSSASIVYQETPDSFVKATIIHPGEALEITAKQDLIDKAGK